jgi:hypothetical protein
MQNDQASDVDVRSMDRVLLEARDNLSTGGKGVAALLASPDEIIAVALLPTIPFEKQVI